METALITALAAVLGSIVGGSATITTAWITQKTQIKRELANAEIRKREALYTDFIVECSRLYIHSFQHNLEGPESMMPAYSLKNRMTLSSSEAVIEAADHILKRILDQYFDKNLSNDEMRNIVESGQNDPLKEFSEACRKDLKNFLIQS
jgi:hypothetical protein